MATVLSEQPERATAEPTIGPTVIDLFAGSGGLSLGLELAGFYPLYVNELDDGARATYLMNRVDRYPQLALPERQSGDIYTVTADSGQLIETADGLRRAAGLLPPLPGTTRRLPEVDLIVGGPPCQGYSGIGHRRTFSGLRKIDIPSNHLFEEMVVFIEAIQPRMFLFENVRGLKSGRWTPGGRVGEIWDDVLTGFKAIEGYEVHDAEVLAKQYGVPQNRPRVLIAGIRTDVAKAAGWSPAPGLPAKGLLPDPGGDYWHPRDFLGDLVDPAYLGKDATTAYPAAANTEAQRWFRTGHDGTVADVGDKLTEHEYSRHNDRIRAKFAYMIANDGQMRPEDRVTPSAPLWNETISAGQYPEPSRPALG